MPDDPPSKRARLEGEFVEVKRISDPIQRTQGRLKELMLHGLLVPGPEALTVDIQGDAGPMRFYAGIDDACNITLADHPERIETLEELVLLCVEPGRQIRKEDLISEDDAAGFLLVKHMERPLSALMSALCARKVKLSSDPLPHGQVHHSIFDEVKPQTSARVRKSVKMFTYSFEELNPGLSKSQNTQSDPERTQGKKPSKRKAKPDVAEPSSSSSANSKKRKKENERAEEEVTPQPGLTAKVSIPVECTQCDAVLSSVASFRRHLTKGIHRLKPQEAEKEARQMLLKLSKTDWQKSMRKRQEAGKGDAILPKRADPDTKPSKSKSKTAKPKQPKTLFNWVSSPEHQAKQRERFECALRRFCAPVKKVDDGESTSTFGPAAEAAAAVPEAKDDCGGREANTDVGEAAAMELEEPRSPRAATEAGVIAGKLTGVAVGPPPLGSHEGPNNNGVGDPAVGTNDAVLALLAMSNFQDASSTDETGGLDRGAQMKCDLPESAVTLGDRRDAESADEATAGEEVATPKSEGGSTPAKETKKDGKRELRKYRRTKVAYDGDPFSMIKCTCFSAARLEQPFSVRTSSNALFIMDLHSHLASTEVIGLLAGQWDPEKKLITIVRAYPCRALEPENGHEREQSVEMDTESQWEAMEKIEAAQTTVVGWYHSHPVFMAEPSIRDIDQQQMAQTFMKNGDDEPYVGYIVAPYDEDSPLGNVSDVRCFWIDHSGVDTRGTPMLAEYTDTKESLDEADWESMRHLIEYYEVYRQRIVMTKGWGKNKMPRLNKLQESLKVRLRNSAVTEDQAASVLEYVKSALQASDELHQTAVVQHMREKAAKEAAEKKEAAKREAARKVAAKEAAKKAADNEKAAQGGAELNQRVVQADDEQPLKRDAEKVSKKGSKKSRTDKDSEKTGKKSSKSQGQKTVVKETIPKSTKKSTIQTPSAKGTSQKDSMKKKSKGSAQGQVLEGTQKSASKSSTPTPASSAALVIEPIGSSISDTVYHSATENLGRKSKKPKASKVQTASPKDPSLSRRPKPSASVTPLSADRPVATGSIVIPASAVNPRRESEVVVPERLAVVGSASARSEGVTVLSDVVHV